MRFHPSPFCLGSVLVLTSLHARLLPQKTLNFTLCTHSNLERLEPGQSASNPHTRHCARLLPRFDRATTPNDPAEPTESMIPRPSAPSF